MHQIKNDSFHWKQTVFFEIFNDGQLTLAPEHVIIAGQPTNHGITLFPNTGQIIASNIRGDDYGYGQSDISGKYRMV